MSHSFSSNRFFKVVLNSTLHNHQLRIPDEFVQKYGNDLSGSVRLIAPTGKVWSVGVKKTDKMVFLNTGLDKLMAENSVGFGNILMFKYKGDSTFKINIFDLGTSEIEYPVPKNDVAEKNDDLSVEFVGSSMDHQRPGKSVRSSGFASGKKRGWDVGGIRSYKKGNSHGRKHESVGRLISSQHKTPSCRIILKPYHFTKRVLRLPVELANLYPSARTQIIKILDGDDNEFNVRCVETHPWGKCLSKGLKQFLQGKELKPGDVCVFEPIRINGECKLKVNISRPIGPPREEPVSAVGESM